MRLSTVPLLSARTRVSEAEEAVVVESDEATLAYEGSSAALMRRVHRMLDGSCTLEEVARSAGVTPEILAATLAPLTEENLLLDGAAAEDARSPAAFLTAFSQECAFYRKEIYAQPFWRQMLAGKASPKVVLGWGIEMYHYVSAANEHMATSVAYCRERFAWRHRLIKHYVEEHDHDAMFLSGLVACGLEEDRVKNAPALPSTRTLINFLTELALSNTFGYAGTFGVMQTSPEETTSEAINTFYNMLVGYYPNVAGIIDAFRKHALVDVGLDHQEIVLEHLCRQPETIPADGFARAAAAARDVTEHFILFFEGILDYYCAESAPIPRRRLDIRALL